MLHAFSADCILSFSGPAGLCSVNEAELAALRLGIRERAKLGLSNIIGEGDSWCANRWASRVTRPPWRLVDMVEEVIELASRINATFVHVLRSP